VTASHVKGAVGNPLACPVRSSFAARRANDSIARFLARGTGKANLLGPILPLSHQRPRARPALNFRSAEPFAERQRNRGSSPAAVGPLSVPTPDRPNLRSIMNPTVDDALNPALTIFQQTCNICLINNTLAPFPHNNVSRSDPAVVRIPAYLWLPHHHSVEDCQTYLPKPGHRRDSGLPNFGVRSQTTINGLGRRQISIVTFAPRAPNLLVATQGAFGRSRFAPSTCPLHSRDLPGRRTAPRLQLSRRSRSAKQERVPGRYLLWAAGLRRPPPRPAYGHHLQRFHRPRSLRPRERFHNREQFPVFRGSAPLIKQ